MQPNAHHTRHVLHSFVLTMRMPGATFAHGQLTEKQQAAPLHRAG